MIESLEPITPGEVLLEEFLEPLAVSQNKLARDLNIPSSRVNFIVKNKRPITVDMALRLAKYFNTSPQMWLNLQDNYDIKKAKQTYWREAQEYVRTYKKVG